MLGATRGHASKNEVAIKRYCMCTKLHVHACFYVCEAKTIKCHKSRLTVVSRAAKQSRAHDTTVCYIHERSILIERSPKAYCKKLPYEKTTRVTKTTYNHLVSKTNTK